MMEETGLFNNDEYFFEKEAATKARHVSIFCQTLSSDRRRLAVGSNDGSVAIWNLDEQLVEGQKPTHRFQGQRRNVYALASTDDLLFAGGDDGIFAYRWADALEQKSPTAVWQCSGTQGSSFMEETNGLEASSQAGTVFSAGGDMNSYGWDAATGQHKVTFKGHTGYVHSIKHLEGRNACVTASEDGTVQIWDVNSGKAEHVLKPSKGGWMSCVDVDSGCDWLACGGKNGLTLWHMRSLKSSGSLETCAMTNNVQAQVVLFYEEGIFSGGNDPNFHLWKYNGEVERQVPTKSTSVFSGKMFTTFDGLRMLTTTGNSSNVDVYYNLGYRSLSLAL